MNTEPYRYSTVRIFNPAENCCQQLLFYKIKRNQPGSGFLFVKSLQQLSFTF